MIRGGTRLHKSVDVFIGERGRPVVTWRGSVFDSGRHTLRQIFSGFTPDPLSTHIPTPAGPFACSAFAGWAVDPRRCRPVSPTASVVGHSLSRAARDVAKHPVDGPPGEVRAGPDPKSEGSKEFFVLRNDHNAAPALAVSVMAMLGATLR